MNNPLNIVKAHPIATGVSVIVIAIIFVVLNSGGESGVAAADSGASAALAAAQAQSTSQQFAIGASKEVALAEQSTRLELGRLEAANQAAAIAAQSTLGLAGIDAERSVQTQQNTLQAYLAEKQYQLEHDSDAMQFATLQAQIAANAAVSQQAIQAQVQVAQINQPKRGLFSKIFG